MKKIYIGLFFIYCVISISNAQYDNSVCGNINFPWHNEIRGIPYYLQPGFGDILELELAVVFVDFPDGRINGEQVFDISQLNQIISSGGNLDAVAELGIDSINGVMTFVPAKYTYYNRWQMFFSTGTYYDNAHPDYNSHNAIAYGSLKEYFREVSNSHVIIKPALTHSQYLNDSIRGYGIINKDTLINGRRIVKSIQLSKNKYGNNSYFENDSATVNQDYFANDVITTIVNLHDSGEIEFDTTGFRGQIVIIFAGGSSCIGGQAHGNKVTSRNMNYNFKNDITHNNNKITRMDGIHIIAHELGHNPPFNFLHTNSGRYCLMNPNSSASHWDCPPHINPAFKIQKGWATPIAYEHSQQVTNLPPVEISNQMGVITIYGKPSASPDWQSGEYFVLENRRKIGFDRKIDIHPDFFYDTANFKGGLLIWHYSPYNQIPGNNCTDILLDKYIKIKFPNPIIENYNYCFNYASPEHFFGYLIQPMFHKLDSNRTFSTFNLKTGIIIDSINQMQTTNSGINFSLNYTINEPQEYDTVLWGQQLSYPLNLSGNVFVHKHNSGGNIIISPGTFIDFIANPICIYGNSSGNAVIKAIGQESNPIIFRGAGYGIYRVSNVGNCLSITESDNSFIDTNIIKYCSIDKSAGGINLNSFNSNSRFAIQYINIQDTSKFLSFQGTTNLSYSDNILVSKYENNYCNLLLDGKVKFENQNDLIINQGYKLRIENRGGSLGGCALNFINPFKIILNGNAFIFGNLIINTDICVTNTGKIYFSIPQQDSTVIKFSPGYGIYCEGELYINKNNQTNAQSVNIDRIGQSGNWKGIVCYNSESIYLNNCRINNAETGLTIEYPNDEVSVLNSTFSCNEFSDIKLNNIYSDNANVNITGNTFYGNNSQLSSIICNEGYSINIIQNIFNDIFSNGISLLYYTNPFLINNQFYATTTPNALPIAGIYSYSSAGFYSCNKITNFYDGIILDNSSPYLLNNEIWNNGYGIFLTNNSNPILSPSFSQNQTLYNAGYNKIFNNLSEEIYCDNEEPSQLSLPYLLKGQNSIFDTINTNDYLINTNYSGDPPLDATDNYWGGNPAGRFYPEGSVSYEPYLESPVSYTNCLPYLQSFDNINLSPDILLFGGANIDDYNKNYNYAIENYKQYLNTYYSSKMSHLIAPRIYFTTIKSCGNYFLLENYFELIANQYIYDTAFYKQSLNLATASDIKQPSYPEAISEYQVIINSTQSAFERHYAYINKMRTIRLMLDSLLNGYGGFNPLFSGYSLNQLNTSLNEIFTNQVNNRNNNKSRNINSRVNFENIKSEKVNKLKEFKEKVNSILKNKETGNIFIDKNQLKELIELKLIEQAILNYISTDRPLNRAPGYQNKNLINEKLIFPEKFFLHQNYPNPFNPVTKIVYEIQQDGLVTLIVYDILGREVKNLVNEIKTAGRYAIFFDGSDLASGIYFYRIQAGEFTEVKRMILIK